MDDPTACIKRAEDIIGTAGITLRNPKLFSDLSDQYTIDNIEEIHDYMKNYSNMTFDDYKKLKQGIKPQNNNSENTKVLEEKHIEVETQSQNKPYKYTNHEYVRSKVEN
jgi:hypothetical protein